MKILDRYLLRSVLGPFVVGVVAFVLLFVSGNILFQLTELVTELGLSIWTAAELFVLRLPGFIVLTFPLATLMALLIVFGRLSGDSELVAMFAGGVSFRRMVVPVAAFGLLVSFATVALSEYVVPLSEHRAEDIIRAATQQAGKQIEQGVLQKETDGQGHVLRLVMADRLDLATQEMQHPIIVEFQGDKPVTLIEAQRAVWEGREWVFYDGTLQKLRSTPAVSASFPVMRAEFTTSPQQLAQRKRQPEELTSRELKEAIAGALRRKEATTKWELTLQRRFAIPFASLVFALIAPALGIRSHRGSSSIGMGLAILIGFGYYVRWNYLSVAAEQGVLSPGWASWLPNIIIGAIGLGLILRVRR
jgi:lipopolysaccharide export system permease protein